MTYRTFFIESYGCQMNMAEANALENGLREAGLSKAGKPEDADLVVINTCSVRATAEDRIWGRIGFWAHVKKSRELTLVVTGCMAQRLLGELKKQAPAVDYVFGVNDKHRIVSLAKGDAGSVCPTYRFDASSWHPGDVTSYVPIMNGCDNFCSYCIVPYVRGRESSRPVADILREVGFLDGKGVREIVLLGQNVDSYRAEENGRIVGFPELLKRVADVCDAIRWIRFESPHPKDLSDDLITLIRDNPRVAKHVHVPLQSGSTRILGLMNRRYTQEQFLSLIEKMRQTVPDITFGVDVMVGFPGETEEEFKETLNVMGIMRATEPFMYYYNPREGTRAVSMPDQIPLDVKHRRLSELIAFENAIVKEEHEKRIGARADILITQTSPKNPDEMLGHTEHNEMVTVPGHYEPGTMMTVVLGSLKGNTFQGKPVAVKE